MEKYFPEGRRLVLFKVLFGILFSVLSFFLVHRQLFQYNQYKEQERKQGQRRIIRPGPRGDIFDRNGKLLIGNKAHFSAKLHLGSIDKEIWTRKKDLRNSSLQIKDKLKQNNSIQVNQLIKDFNYLEEIRNRFVRISGKAKKSKEEWLRVMLYFQGNRLPVEQDKGGNWYCNLPELDSNSINSLEIKNIEGKIGVNLSNLLTVYFPIDAKGEIMPALPEITNSSESFWNSISTEEPTWEKVFSVSNSSITWEARLSVVQKYTDQINKLIGRNKVFELRQLIRHWREQLLLPIELASDLKPIEYATLVEEIDANSPISVQAEAIRHYPLKDLASHVLGYVGSGYEAKPDGLSGSDLATFEIKGRKGKAGLEKVFDEQLRGMDGGEIWRVNPDGSRYDQIEKKVSQRGESLKISIDAELQKIAEDSIQEMVFGVSKTRILPDKDWRKTILRRTNQALIGSNEKKVSAQLLLSAFVDAPFPLNGEEASTVAGFQGTAKDADRLLKILYAKGVLSKPNLKVDEYELAPPPLPPGAAVLINLKNGEILALASKPNYDLSKLTPFIPQSVYDQIQRREAWLPRAWHPGYAPASPFKLVTALAGYREAKLEANATMKCDGIYRGMECHVFPGAHGEMNLHDAISQSCNVYFFRLAEKIGYQKLIDTANLLRLNESPSIEVPTLRDRPIVPDPEWKKKRIGVRWTLEDTFNISIGQGGLRQSPLQMACMVAKIATNRQFFQPSLIYSKQSSLPPSPNLGISAHALQEIITGMHHATQRGTARRCQINDVPVAGKTGTGQWRNHNMNLNLAWFVGFAPVDKPEVAVATLVEGVIPQDHVQGGLTATPIARDLLQAYFDQKNAKLAFGEN